MEKIPKSIRTSFQRPENSSGDNVYPIQGVGNCIAFADDARELRRFRLIFTDGRKISIPYARLPIVLLDTEGTLTLRMGDTEIIIEGRGLEMVEELFSEERIKYLRESNLSVDDFQQDVYIKSITANGRAVI
jgi:hypothetical protein